MIFNRKFLIQFGSLLFSVYVYVYVYVDVDVDVDVVDPFLCGNWEFLMQKGPIRILWLICLIF